VAAVDGRPDFVKDGVAQNEVRERLADPRARHRLQIDVADGLHVRAVLRQWNRRGANVLVVPQIDDRGVAAFGGDAIAVRGSTDDSAAGDLDVALGLQEFEAWLDDAEDYAEPLASSAPDSSPL
jgi:hypothetical protein